MITKRRGVKIVDFMNYRSNGQSSSKLIPLGLFGWSKVSQTNNQYQIPHVVIQKIPVQSSLNLVNRDHPLYEPGLADQLGRESLKVVWGHSPRFLDGGTEHKKDPEIQKLSLNAKVTLLYIIIWLSQRLHSLVKALSEKALLSKKSVFKNCRAGPLSLAVQCSPHKAHHCQRISKGHLPAFLTHEVSPNSVQSKLAQNFPTPFAL